MHLEPLRPETTCLTAHRLITGALGMRSQMATEQVGEEKQKLQDAKGIISLLLLLLKKYNVHRHRYASTNCELQY